MPARRATRSANRKVPVRLPISSRLVDAPAGVGLLARRMRPAVPAGCSPGTAAFAAELACALHGVLGDQVGFDEVAAPDRVQHDVLGDEDVLALLALLHAAPPDRLQLLVGRVELARPLQQQRVLDGGPEYQRREDYSGSSNSSARASRSFVEPMSGQKAQDDPHRQRHAEQMRHAELLGVGHRLLRGPQTGLGLVGVDQRSSASVINICTRSGLSPSIVGSACCSRRDVFEESLAVETHDGQPAQRLCAQVARRQLLDGVLQHGRRAFAVTRIEMVERRLQPALRR